MPGKRNCRGDGLAVGSEQRKVGIDRVRGQRIFEDAGVQKVGVWKVADAPTPKAAEPAAEPQAEVAAEDAIWQVAVPEDAESAPAADLPDLPALAARIAALPAAALLPWRARLRSLRDRLLTLEDRMTAPPY